MKSELIELRALLRAKTDECAQKDTYIVECNTAVEAANLDMEIAKRLAVVLKRSKEEWKRVDLARAGMIARLKQQVANLGGTVA